MVDRTWATAIQEFEEKKKQGIPLGIHAYAVHRAEEELTTFHVALTGTIWAWIKCVNEDVIIYCKPVNCEFYIKIGELNSTLKIAKDNSVDNHFNTEALITDLETLYRNLV